MFVVIVKYCIRFLVQIMEKFISLKSFSTHPDEYSIPAKSLKELHPCRSGECLNRKASLRCIRRFYEVVDQKAVYHHCGRNCSFQADFPNIPHVSILKSATDDTFPEGLPFIDVIYNKMEDLGELSYLNSVEHLLNDMRNMRCVSKENFVTLTREKRLFSVTLGVDSAVTIEDTLRKFTDIVTSRFHPVIAIDVEGKAVGSGAVPDLSKIHLGNPYTPIFLEINFPRDDKGKYRGAAADVAPIKNLFDVDDIVFAGSAMSEDILMIEQTLSTIGTEPWTMVGNTLDVAAMWVCLGNWTRNSYGVQALTYIISGGIQLKNFKLSCAKDWSIDWRNLDWSHTVYNIGDQLSIINALYTLLTMLIPTLFPCKREAFEAFGPEFPTIFNAFFIEQFLNVQLLEQQFQRSDPWNRRRCVLLSSDDLVRVRNPPCLRTVLQLLAGEDQTRLVRRSAILTNKMSKKSK